MNRLRHCLFDPDQRGNPRYYARLRVGLKWRKIRIREPFEDAEGNITEDFMRAYWAALTELRGQGEPAKKAPPRETTFNWLCDQYFRSTKFTRYDPATQRDKRSVLNRFCETAGDLPYKKYRKEDMEKSQLKRKATPGAADKLVRVIRALFNWAIDQKPPLADFNPAARLDKINMKTGGFHTWTEDEIDRFRAYWPIGSKPRLAMEVMINVGARRSDAARIGPRDEYKDKGKRWIRFTAHKGRNRHPAVIESKLTPDLIEALAKTEIGTDAYVLSQYRKPYTIESFGNAFSKWCGEAGLPHCSSHGLRKAASVAYAESNASAPELQALFGWTNLRTAQTYIEKANKRRMSANAQDRLEEYRTRANVSVLEAEKADETNDGKTDGKTKTEKGDGGR